MGLGVHKGEFVVLDRQIRDQLLGGDAQVADHGQIIGPFDFVDLSDTDAVDPPGHNSPKRHCRTQGVRVSVDDNKPVLIFFEEAEKFLYLFIQLSEKCHKLSLFQD